MRLLELYIIDVMSKERKEMRKTKKFAQKKVNDFFDDCRNMGNSFLENALKNAKTEKERKRIKRLLKDFS